MTTPFRIGTRASALALWQANWVKTELERKWPDLAVELVQIKTTGDKILNVPLSEVGGKGLFTKEIDEALLDGRVDAAVHSMKDIPYQLPQGIDFGAIPEREDPRDALISNGRQIDALPPAARIGTSSLRRAGATAASLPFRADYPAARECRYAPSKTCRGRVRRHHSRSCRPATPGPRSRRKPDPR